jgi:hypothetical protein
MKTSTVGLVLAAILMVVAGVGFGIAQAEAEIPQAANSSASDMQLTSAGHEFVPEDNYSGTDWQTRGPVETGAIPGAAVEESWMKDYGND